jgi:Cu/Ag efflux pump CusA
LLFDRFRQLEQHEREAFGPGLVLRGARERTAPVVMTALATGLVFVPVLVMGSRPGLELLHPIAVVVVGGLITSALFTLFVLPVLYLRFGSSGAAEAAEAEELIPVSGATGAAGAIAMTERPAVQDPAGD